MQKILLFIFIGLFLLLALNIALGIWLSLYNRKCPYCGKRMKHMKNKLDEHGDIEEYVFHCEHCGAWQHLTPMEILREQE